MKETKGTNLRDNKILLQLLNDQAGESQEKIKAFLESDQSSLDAEQICVLRNFLDENNLSIKNIVDADSDTRSYCDNMVCSIAACVFNSSCSGGACSNAGCAANAGGGVTPPANCKNASTCGTQSCSSNAGGSCGNAVCSYVSGGHNNDDDL